MKEKKKKNIYIYIVESIKKALTGVSTHIDTLNVPTTTTSR